MDNQSTIIENSINNEVKKSHTDNGKELIENRSFQLSKKLKIESCDVNSALYLASQKVDYKNRHISTVKAFINNPNLKN